MQGSVEAIVTALNNISTDEIKVRVLLAGVGGITESDMLLAAASNAPLIGFNVRPNSKAAALAKRDRVRLKYFDVIYHLTADIAKEMAGELGPEIIETVVGRAEVKDVFKSGKRDKAAGLLVTEGIIKKGLSRTSYPRRRHRVENHDCLAAPVQGQYRRSACWSRMWCRVGGYQRRQGRRYARGL